MIYFEIGKEEWDGRYFLTKLVTELFGRRVLNSYFRRDFRRTSLETSRAELLHDGRAPGSRAVELWEHRPGQGRERHTLDTNGAGLQACQLAGL